MLKRNVFVVAGLACLLPVVPCAAQTPAIERFEKKIRPLLIAKCVSCHGPEKKKGGLRLDTAEALAEGGDSGPAVEKGKPDDSRLIEVVKYASDLKMPPKGKLSDAEIADLTAWVREGAVWPGRSTPTPAAKPTSLEAKITPEDRDFWAFRPVREPVPPRIDRPERAKSPIDRFILAELDKKGLTPAPPAEKRDLIRRATFDLTGLPPTPEEIDAFLADTSEDAFARVVDRLLASSAYGERWGRHWLDLARYADSNGMDENVAYANAHFYRDYVVRSFNADKPYDQFVVEQIAGDLLPPTSNESVDHDRVTATGFLVLGPKMLAEDDPMKMEMDIIDEQVDTVGRVFMGLTLGCARCHDHKFDPIPTSDYYGLAGIFKSTKSMQNHKVVAMWNERPLANPAERKALEAHRKRVEELNASVKSLTNKARAELRKEIKTRSADYILAAIESKGTAKLASKSAMAAGGTPPAGTLIREAESFDKGNVLIDRENYGKGIGVILNKGELPNFTEYVFDIPKAGVYRLEIRLAAEVSRPVSVSFNGKPRFDEAAKGVTGSWLPDTQKWFAEGLAALDKGKTTVRLDCAGPFPHFDKIALVPVEGLDGRPARTAEELAKERKLNAPLIERWAEFLTKEPALKPEAGEKPEAVAKRFADLFAAAEKANAEAVSKDKTLAAFKRIVDDPNGPLSLPKGNQIDRFFSAEAGTSIKKAKEELAAVEKNAPPVTEVMAVEERATTNLKIHIRGNHTTLGEEVPRRFPRVLAGDMSTPMPKDRSGRLELARWLASPEHPLTARVMVNRIWQGHFGLGLVRSPDNFGKLGRRPTHPELLDWLASRFVASGWSIKSMHRMIMLSATYRMSTRLDEKAALVDPDNTLRWRFDRRRLEAESIRDAILFVSGELKAGTPGSLLPTKNHAYVNNTGERGRILYESVVNRSIYLPIIRSGVYEVLQAFDFADPSSSNGERVPTTVAPQALFMLNDQLMLRSSESLAKSILARPGLDERARVAVAYRSVFGRRPTEAETLRVLNYLDRFATFLAAEKVEPAARPLRTWQTLCQALLASSEFLYLD